MFDYSSFLGSDVLAVTSDASVDFRTEDVSSGGEVSLNGAQKAWLEKCVPCFSGVIFPKQVHGERIWEAEAASLSGLGTYEADAVVTSVPGLPIAIRTADCLPVLMADPSGKAVAAVHAGWRSAHLSIVPKTVQRMEERYGIDPRVLKVVFGPCIRKGSYEVGSEFRQNFPEDVDQVNGRLCLDLAAAVRRQLIACGVQTANIFDCGLDTFTDKNFFSYRRDGAKAGRMLSLIAIRG